MNVFFPRILVMSFGPVGGHASSLSAAGNLNSQTGWRSIRRSGVIIMWMPASFWSEMYSAGRERGWADPAENVPHGRIQSVREVISRRQSCPADSQVWRGAQPEVWGSVSLSQKDRELKLERALKRQHTSYQIKVYYSGWITSLSESIREKMWNIGPR